MGFIIFKKYFLLIKLQIGEAAAMAVDGSGKTLVAAAEGRCAGEKHPLPRPMAD